MKDVVEVKKLEYSKNDLVKIRSEYEQDINAFINREEFSSIISNLINNSIEAIQEKSFALIDIKMINKDGFVIIDIKDNGIGIEDNKIAHVFDYGCSTKSSGKGCGLFHAKKILSNWKGSIEIESEVKIGTLVRISIPLSDSSNEIILIDDELLNILSWKGVAKRRNIISYMDYLAIDSVEFANPKTQKKELLYLVDIAVGGGNGAYLFYKRDQNGNLQKIYEDFDGDLYFCNEQYLK